MNRKQFNILVFLEEQKAAKSQREIAAATEMSVGSVNKAMAELSANGFDYGIDVLCGTLDDKLTVNSENKTIEVKLN